MKKRVILEKFLLFGLLAMASSLKEINDTIHNIISFDLVFLFIGIWLYFFHFSFLRIIWEQIS